MNYSIIIRTLGTAGEYYQRTLDSIKLQTIQPGLVLVYIPEGYAIPKETIGIEQYIYVKKGMVAQRACLGEKQIPLAKKKQILYEWLSHSYFRSFRLSNYMIDWRNRLMVYFMKLKCIAVSYLIVNGKRMLMCK